MGKNPTYGKNARGKQPKNSSAEKPVSLKPLKFKEAVESILKVGPDPKGKSAK